MDDHPGDRAAWLIDELRAFTQTELDELTRLGEGLAALRDREVVDPALDADAIWQRVQARMLATPEHDPGGGTDDPPGAEPAG